MTSEGAARTVAAARVAVAAVLSDGEHARVIDIWQALRLAHRALDVAERTLSATSAADTLPSPAMGDEQTETQ